MRRLEVVALLLVGAANVASAQRGFPARLAPATRETLERIVDSARTVGLPVEPLHAKAAEGALKGATDARIVVAVRTLMRELADARDALPPNASVSLLSAGASALHAGVSSRDLRQLMGAGGNASESDLAVALVTLADLVANRVPPDAAARSVQALLRRGAPESEMVALRTGVAQDILAGRSPESALGSRVRP